MRTKLETFFLEELHRLLKMAMDERDGWCQDKVYEILCRAHQLPADQKSPMTEAQKQAAAQIMSGEAQSMSAALGATTWGQQNGWPSPQLREAMSGTDIMKLQAEPIRFPATEETSRILAEHILPSFITPKELESYQVRLKAEKAAQSRSNFKEYILTDPTLGISCRITFSEGKK